MDNELTRRQFLTAAAGLAVAATNPIRSTASPEQDTPPRLPEKIRVGIIGLDGHYSEITSAARLVPNIRITSIADPRDAVLRRLAGSPDFAAAKTWTDYHKMLASEKLDIVCVCGENGTRAATVRACAERGLPIVTEKPLALRLSDLAAVKRVVNRNHVPLTMLLTMRFAPQYRAMRNVVHSGEIGEVVSMDAQKSYQLGTRPDWMKDRKSYGGTIPYIGIHYVDLMRWISGRELIKAAAFHSNVGVPEIGEMENNTAVIFKLDNRGTASLHMDYLRPATAPTHGNDRLRIVGTKGVIEYQEGQGLTLVTTTQPPIKINELAAVKPLFIDFVESLYQGKPHLISTDDIFRISEIVLKARTAADTNRVVRL